MAHTLHRNEFCCDYCNRSFTRKHNLQTHIEHSCHSKTFCFCEICNYVFGSPVRLQTHLSRGHNRFGKPSPECDICGRIFNRKQNITAHMITAHLQHLCPKIKCEICDRSFTTNKNLKRHMKMLHNPNIEYPICDDCNKTFKSKHSLLAHYQAVHNRNKKLKRCNLCEKVYSSNRNLKRHIDTFHGEKEEHRCEICPKVYPSKQSLKRHLKTHETCEEPESDSNFIVDDIDTDDDDSDNYDSKMYAFLCSACHEPFNQEQILRQHVKVKHSFETFYEYCKEYLQRLKDNRPLIQRVYKCEFCFLAFLNVYELKDHMKVHHFFDFCLSTCNVCYTKFYSKEFMVQHRKICLPPPNVNSCRYCDKLFTDISSLEFHLRIFHPQSQISDNVISSTKQVMKTTESLNCSQCSRIYSSMQYLKIHMKLKHTADEKVECEECGQVYSNKHCLASHFKTIHSSCAKSDYCEKILRTKTKMRRHIEFKHTGLRQYKCIDCGSFYKDLLNLRKHVRRKHKDSTSFPQCHICNSLFDSAKSRKTHLKQVHNLIISTYPCHLCSVSFGSKESLKIHLASKHLDEKETYKCEECNLVFKGLRKFKQHNVGKHEGHSTPIQKKTPQCIKCFKDFSTKKNLKSHIKRLHTDSEVEEIKNSLKNTEANCDDCIKSFTDDHTIKMFDTIKDSNDRRAYECKTCGRSFNSMEFAEQRQKFSAVHKSKTMLSELCTAEMSDTSCTGYGALQQHMEPESTTSEVKLEPLDDVMIFKAEPMSP